MRDVQETHLLTKCVMKGICVTLFPPKRCLCSLKPGANVCDLAVSVLEDGWGFAGVEGVKNYCDLPSVT